MRERRPAPEQQVEPRSERVGGSLQARGSVQLASQMGNVAFTALARTLARQPDEEGPTIGPGGILEFPPDHIGPSGEEPTIGPGGILEFPPDYIGPDHRLHRRRPRPDHRPRRHPRVPARPHRPQRRGTHRSAPTAPSSSRPTTSAPEATARARPKAPTASSSSRPTTSAPRAPERAPLRVTPAGSTEPGRMCRWVAYFGNPIHPEALLYDTPHSLVEQSRSDRLAGGQPNADGVGLGWYGERDDARPLSQRRAGMGRSQPARDRLPGPLAAVPRAHPRGDRDAGRADQLPPVPPRPLAVHAQRLHRGLPRPAAGAAPRRRSVDLLRHRRHDGLRADVLPRAHLRPAGGAARLRWSAWPGSSRRRAAATASTSRCR